MSDTPDTPSTADHPRTVAVIGSFRQHLSLVKEAVEAFRNTGWTITSPPGGEVIEPNIEFVRFEADNVDHDDFTVQTVAMHRILRATLIYVVAPQGYVGKTTCYEIGRAIQSNRPVYFSHPPADLPLRVPTEVVAPARTLAAHDPDTLIKAAQWPDPTGEGWEKALIEHRFLNL